MARKSLITFLVNNSRIFISSIDYIFEELVLDCKEKNRNLSKIDLREIDKVKRRMKNGQEDYFEKSYLYTDMKHYFIAYSK